MACRGGPPGPSVRTLARREWRRLAAGRARRACGLPPGLEADSAVDRSIGPEAAAKEQRRAPQHLDAVNSVPLDEELDPRLNSLEQGLTEQRLALQRLDEQSRAVAVRLEEHSQQNIGALESSLTGLGVRVEHLEAASRSQVDHDTDVAQALQRLSDVSDRLTLLHSEMEQRFDEVAGDLDALDADVLKWDSQLRGLAASSAQGQHLAGVRLQAVETNLSELMHTLVDHGVDVPGFTFDVLSPAALNAAQDARDQAVEASRARHPASSSAHRGKGQGRGNPPRAQGAPQPRRRKPRPPDPGANMTPADFARTNARADRLEERARRGDYS